MKREIALTSRYLNLPVKNGAPVRHLKLIVDGNVVREFEVELADGVEPDFWTFLDISAWKGKSAVLEVADMPVPSMALAATRQGDEIEGAADLYHEKYRPQFHFTSRRGWLNDPNGLVYDHGEYHRYYQHNPYGVGARDMHWGHAVSTAFYPPKFGDWAWSGSVVVDHANTAGFQTGKDAPIVVAYTSTGRGECIAFSNDRGRVFTQYDGKPVIKHTGRDPSIFWCAKSEHWVMALYDEPGGIASRDARRGTSVAFGGHQLRSPSADMVPLSGFVEEALSPASPPFSHRNGRKASPPAALSALLASRLALIHTISQHDL